MDSGSNVILFHKLLQGIKLHAGDIQIATASSQGFINVTQKAALPLQSEMGTEIEFTDSYYSTDLHDNLMSVGIACEAGLVCVFDKSKLRVFQEDKFVATGNVVSTTDREANGLYYWTLYSKDKKSRGEAYVAKAKRFTANSLRCPEMVTVEAIRTAFPELQPICARANAALDFRRSFKAVDLSGPLSTERLAALSKSYEVNLSPFELYHGRLAHLNTKFIKLVYNVDLPKKTGCIECVHGKGHHIKPKPVDQNLSTDRNLKPGEMFEADFCGPYAGSCGRNRYCENFIDRKSKYSFVFPSKDQTAHYSNFPQLYAEAKGRSGNSMRFFKTDNGGVFIGERGKAMLLERCIVQERSPPHNHLKRVERFNRTSEEAAKTNLLTAGAPSTHWAMVKEAWNFVWTHIAVYKQDDGTFLSLANIFENNRRYFDPKYFRAYGTFGLSLIPSEQRATGKSPAGETHEPGVIVGYLETGDGWLFQSFHPSRYGVVLERAFGDVTTFEGCFPYRNRAYWTQSDLNSPRCFIPTLQSLLDPTEWGRYDFNAEDEQNALKSILPNMADQIQDITQFETRSPNFPLDSPSMELPAPGGYYLRSRDKGVVRDSDLPYEEKHAVPDPVDQSIDSRPAQVHVPEVESDRHEPVESQPVAEVEPVQLSQPSGPIAILPELPALEGLIKAEELEALPPLEEFTLSNKVSDSLVESPQPDVMEVKAEQPASEDFFGDIPDVVAAREIFPQPGDTTFCVEYNQDIRLFEVEELLILPTKRKDPKSNQEKTPSGHVEAQYVRTGEFAVMPRWNLNWTRDEAQLRADQSNAEAIESKAAKSAILEQLRYRANRTKWETDWNRLDFKSMLDSIPSPITEKSAFRVRAAAAMVAASAEVDPDFDKPIGIPPPTTLKEVMDSKWRRFYEAASDLEMKTLEDNKTWDVVDRKDVPTDVTIVGSKIVYADKRGPNGSMVKFKARVVAKGFSQKYMEDYFETYASVAEFKTIRLLLAHYNQNPDWSAEAWDAEAAFVQPPLEETVYMHIPPPYNNKYPGKVFKLKKCLYGLKQAARAWQKFCHDIMESNEGKCCPRDPALYIFRVDKAILLIATHVDDFFVFFNRYGAYLRDKVWNSFSEKCRRINNLGPIRWALKTCVEEDKEVGILKISLEGFATSMVQRFNLEGIPYADTPAIASGKDAKITADDLPQTNEEKELAAQYPIREVTGCAWWMIHICRVDLYNATLRISRWQNKPSAKLWRWCLQLLRYINKTKALGLVYRRQLDIPKHIFTGAADASLADVVGDDDSKRSKSTLSWLFFYFGALISWGCMTSTRVLQSSCEAECSALVELSKENRWFRALMLYLGLHGDCGITPTLVREDNQAAITLSGERVNHGRTRHFDLEWDICRECILLKEMTLFWISTENQWADLNTKSLPAAVFKRHVHAIMGSDEFQNHFKKAVASVANLQIADDECDKVIFNDFRAQFHLGASACAEINPGPRSQASAARWFQPASGPMSVWPEWGERKDF